MRGGAKYRVYTGEGGLMRVAGDRSGLAMVASRMGCTLAGINISARDREVMSSRYVYGISGVEG